MAGGAGFDEEDGITDINVTPFVDVMLVLLIIFMVTANYIQNQAIEMDLPSAATGEAVEQKNLEFAIDKSNKLFLDGKPVEIETLVDLIASRKAENEKIGALISADKATPHGAVMKLIDAIRKGGVTDFAINVEAETN